MNDPSEWLEADGLGGFASGTVDGIRTRRYHALLLAATEPPSGRMALVNGLEASVTTPRGSFAISSHRYLPDVVHPAGSEAIRGFRREPWPAWTFGLGDGTELVQELFVPKGRALVAMSWRLAEPAPGVSLSVRPLLSGRDYHATHRENPAFRFAASLDGDVVRWAPYDGVPAVAALSNGAYAAEPLWYRSFLYLAERERGLDCVEDLASPGVFRFDLAAGPAVWILAAEIGGDAAFAPGERAAETHETLRGSEAKRRSAFASPLHRAADAYVVARGSGRTIVAGYPWFTDWGRDTFIAIRGLCIATGRLEDARRILLEWAGEVSLGMLPNRFPEGPASGRAAPAAPGRRRTPAQPEFNSVDASLWYVIAVRDFLRAAAARRFRVTAGHRRALDEAVLAIVAGHVAGTRFGIRLDADGLLAAGVPGVPLTWMDARVGATAITPRAGKPVEVQALWLNALDSASELDPGLRPLVARGLESFGERFWNERLGWLNDVVDVDGERGRDDASLRPNQVLAVGGLPLPLLAGPRAESALRAVEQKLLTPLGLRTLAPDEPGYAPDYTGGPAARDAAYHQGTVWPWLLGPFVEAWVRVRGGSEEARAAARERFLPPLRAHLETAGLGHVSEIAGAEPPYEPRGCPFQAWSLGELLRLELSVLGTSGATAGGSRE